MKRSISVVILLIIMAATSIFGEVPKKLNFQGVLTDDVGNALEGTHHIAFKIYNVEIDGSAMWAETQSVTVTKGIFNAILGTVTALNLPFNEQYYLGITVEGGNELTPRIPLAASAYSLNSHSAEMLANAVYVDDESDVGIGIENPSEKLQVAGTIHSTTGGFKFPDGTIQTTADSGTEGLSLPFADTTNVAYSAFRIYNEGQGAAIMGQNSANNTIGYLGYIQYGVLGTSATAGVRGLNDNGNYGHLGTSNQGVYGEHFDGHYGHLGGPTYGAYGRNTNGNRGYLALSNYGVAGYSDTVGVHGYNSEIGNYGRLGTRNYGVIGRNANGNVGYIAGTNQGVSGGNANGNYGYLGTPNEGVYGEATVTGDVKNYGGYFVAHGDSGIGVYGEGAYGGYFVGNVCAEGAIHSTTGGFKFPDGTIQTTAATGGSGDLLLPYSGTTSYELSALQISNSGGGPAIMGQNSANNNYGYIGTSAYGVSGFSGYAGVHGRNDNGNYGRLGTSDYGVYGSNNNGTFGYFGGTLGAFGSNGSGDYGYLGGVDRGVFGLAGNPGDVQNYGGYFEARGYQGTGVYGLASSTETAMKYGGYFLAHGPVSFGVRGEASGMGGIGAMGYASYSGSSVNYGGYFSAAGHGGRGVVGLASYYGDVRNYGGFFEASGSRGRGVQGEASGAEGTGVFGNASNTGDVHNIGGSFQARGSYGRGIYAIADKEGDYINYGGYFEACGNRGRGVYGLASYNSGNDVWPTGGLFVAEGGNTAVGVCGQALNTGDVVNYGGHFTSSGNRGVGVYAKGGSNGNAAEFVGNVVLKSRTNPDFIIMELGEGLDYAEGFNVADIDIVAPGTVLIIDPINPGKLSASCEAYDKKVAGIVAGANGQGSGVRLGADQYDCDVALAGRVYCNVDASEYTVEPGDLLTTSSIPGYAMKAMDFQRSQGAILGKAMEGLEKGNKKQILVLVTLQ